MPELQELGSEPVAAAAGELQVTALDQGRRQPVSGAAREAERAGKVVQGSDAPCDRVDDFEPRTSVCVPAIEDFATVCPSAGSFLGAVPFFDRFVIYLPSQSRRAACLVSPVRPRKL